MFRIWVQKDIPIRNIFSELERLKCVFLLHKMLKCQSLCGSIFYVLERNRVGIIPHLYVLECTIGGNLCEK